MNITSFTDEQGVVFILSTPIEVHYFNTIMSHQCTAFDEYMKDKMTDEHGITHNVLLSISFHVVSRPFSPDSLSCEINVKVENDDENDTIYLRACDVIEEWVKDPMLYVAYTNGCNEYTHCGDVEEDDFLAMLVRGQL